MFEQFWHFFELLLAKKHVSKRHIVQLYFTPSKRFLLKSHEVRSTQQIQKKARQNCKTLCFSVFCKLASLRTCASHFSFCDSISSSIALNALLVAASHVSRHPDMRLTHSTDENIQESEKKDLAAAMHEMTFSKASSESSVISLWIFVLLCLLCAFSPLFLLWMLGFS